MTKLETAQACRAALLVALVLTLAACSGSEKRLEYRHSQGGTALKIPAGLEAPRSEAMLILPEASAEAVEWDPSPPVNLPDELLQPDNSSDESGKVKKARPASRGGFELD